MRKPGKKAPRAAKTRTKKPLARKKPAAGAKGKSKPAPKPKKPEKEMGRVVAFFRIPVVAVIRVKQGILKMGDRIWIRGHTTDLKMTVTSMQINHQPIQEAKKGSELGVKVASRVRIGDRVYRLPG